MGCTNSKKHPEAEPLLTGKGSPLAIPPADGAAAATTTQPVPLVSAKSDGKVGGLVTVEGSVPVDSMLPIVGAAVEFEEVPHLGELGEIRLSFQYMTEERCLILNVHELRKLDGKYIASQLLIKSRLVNEENLTVDKCKTTIKEGKTPVFEEIFTFNNLEQASVARDVLMVALFERPTTGADRMIGEFRYRLRHMNAEQGLPRFYPLKLYKDRPKSISEVLVTKLAIGDTPSDDSAPGTRNLTTPSTPSTPTAEKRTVRGAKKARPMSLAGGKGGDNASIGSREDLGELLVKGTYVAATGTLTVKVVEIREPEFLVHPDSASVYVNATLKEHKQKQKTKAYPRYGVVHVTETFVFEVKPADLKEEEVDLSLKVASNSFVGVTTVDFKEREGDFDFEETFPLEARSLVRSMSSAKSLFRRNSTSSIGSKFEGEVPNDNEFGELSIGVRYTTNEKKLVVTVSEGRNLKSCDDNGLSDPYVEVRLLPEDPKKKKKEKDQKTKVVKKSLNPRWEESFEFTLTPAELPDRRIQLLVWDEDAVGRDFMGEAIIEPTSLELDQLNKGWHKLNKKGAGLLKVRFTYNPEPNTLDVNIISGKDLVPLGSSISIDAYVKVYLQPDKSKQTKRKTTTKKDSLDPKWNETVSYQLANIADWQSRTIVVTLHDQDKLKNNPEVGEFSLPMSEVIEQKKIVGWYTLFK